MNLDADITQEELKVFIEEASEHIDLMDEDIVRLEKEGEDPELLQEIFRAAHTIKGSSAMIGYQPMAELTHAMESLLDKLRNKNLTVDTEIIDALLFGLDILKLLMDTITAPEENTPDITPAIIKIKEVSDRNKESKVVFHPLKLDTSLFQEVLDSISPEQNFMKITVTINSNSDWPAVRCLQCINELTQHGEIIASSPSEEEIEEESAYTQIEFAFISETDAEKIISLLSFISDIDNVAVVPYTSDMVDEVSGETDPSRESAGPANNSANAVQSSGKTAAVSKKKETSRQETSQSVRVDVEILDSLLNVVEELVIDRSKISQVGKMLESKYPGDELIDELAETSDHIIKTINELQEYIMQVRMVPIGTIFSRFPRMVRDLAQSQQKKLDFIVEGADTELDRTIIEQIRDPLTHLLRNAVDHGIESADIRKASGKPETANVRLNAYREQSHIIIVVEDDGKGISPEKIKDTAVNKGLIPLSKAEGLSDTELINLIFLPGMSTTEKATEVSGRGVGMDIVKTNVESLGGNVSIETKPGKGSKFIIRLPLTVAIVQGFLISVSGSIYILPMSSIAETVSIDNSTIQTIQGREIIRWRDSLIPVVRLNEVFDEATSETVETDRSLVVILSADNFLIGLVIDELLETQEIVVKSLGNYLGDVEGIAGATILGDGRVALILDVSSLIKMVFLSDRSLSMASAF
ncbi:MAG: chemotaxis protein CheA [Dehalococcoidales bacterium]|nr:chemotaxis protein CheA [Dehalococcoidales bacterium]